MQQSIHSWIFQQKLQVKRSSQNTAYYVTLKILSIVTEKLNRQSL
jgi:hypothetical protein